MTCVLIPTLAQTFHRNHDTWHCYPLRYGHGMGMSQSEAPQAATVPLRHGHRSAAFNAFCRLACKSTGLRDVRPLQLAHTRIFKPRRPLAGVLGKDSGNQVLRLQISQHSVRSFENKGSFEENGWACSIRDAYKRFFGKHFEIGSRRPNVVPPL